MSPTSSCSDDDSISTIKEEEITSPKEGEMEEERSMNKGAQKIQIESLS